ncbi:MAG: 2Fe-2S iron-sulfur cluster-binding protein [Vicinamibacteria bacterium]|jgi:NADH-quinone oxidoreductase subunit G|nr:2Fe-2S iron-sulfur cluster-binding protein [Vicinamibacteria bacterium]
MPKLTIDGREIEVAQGTTVIQAARALDIAIPHFCWHPDLSVDGNCRMCLVEIEKQPKLQISCNTQAADGMVVHTQTPRVLEARRTTLEFLLVNHPIDCPVCDQAGECYLQDQYMAHGLHDSQIALEDKVRKPKVVDLGPIVLDEERCVLCSRCIRFEREVTGTNQLAFIGRGNETRIATFEDRPITHNYAGNLADVCPVGALLSRDFRFKMRVWFLTSTPSVCPGCSTGCNIFIDQRDNEVQRLRPRRNVAVNKSWMCDIGRGLYRPLASPARLTRVRAGGTAAGKWDSLAPAFDQLAEKLRAAGHAVALVGTPQATNEDHFALRLLADVTGARLDFRVGDPQARLTEREDAVLLRADRNPNTQGALDLGLARTGVAAILDACRRGEVQVLLLAGTELLNLLEAHEALRQVPYVVVMATHADPALDRAQLVLPVAAWAEVDGTFTNFERRVQRIRRAVPAPGDARPRYELIFELLRRLGIASIANSANEVFTQIASVMPAYKGLDYHALPGSGALVPPQEGTK